MGVGKKMDLLILLKRWFWVSGQKGNVLFVKLAKIVFKNVLWTKNKKNMARISVGFLVLSIFLLTVLSHCITFQFICRFCLFTLGGNTKIS